MTNKSNWMYCTAYDRKFKNTTYHYIWRPIDDGAVYVFDQYGFAIEMISDRKGNKSYRCCICQRDMMKGGFAHGNKFKTVEEAYADIDKLIEICGKAFWMHQMMHDRYYTSRVRDKANMLKTAEKNGFIR